MKKILVTGSSGFIGQHLVPALEQLGHDIIRADRTHGIDLTKKEIVDDLPDVDIVVHLAAHNGTKHFYERPLDVIRDGILPTQYLIDRYAGKVERFVFTVFTKKFSIISLVNKKTCFLAINKINFKNMIIFFY